MSSSESRSQRYKLLSDTGEKSRVCRSFRFWIGLTVFSLSLTLLLCNAPDIGHYLSAGDLSYQLSWGRQILFNHFPFIDFFIHYGPMVALTSSAGLAIWDCVVPEVVICAVGYSLAVTLIFLLASYSIESSPRLAAALGLTLSIVSLLLLPRFYKWYFWLFPLLVLYCFNRFLESNGTRRAILLLTGFSAGVGWLYRFEVGVVYAVAVTTMLFVQAIKPFDLKGFFYKLTLFIAGLSLAMAPWYIALLSIGGVGSVRDYLVGTFVGGAGIAKHWSVSIPSYDWDSPFSLNSSHAAACYLLITTYVVALPWSLWHVWFRTETESSKPIFMLIVTLVGIGLLPQALYRADVHHFLQVLPLMLLTGSTLVCQIWATSSVKWTGSMSIAVKGMLILYMALTLSAFMGIAGKARLDLTPFSWNLVDKYRNLVKGPEALPDHPISQLTAKIRELTSEDELILTPVALTPQILTWANRPMSGILPTYQFGVFDTPEWRIRNFKAVESRPPAVVVVRPDAFTRTDPRSLRIRHPELHDFLSRKYRRAVYRQGNEFVIFAQ